MDHFEFEEQTRDMTPQERSAYFHGLSEETQQNLMGSTFDFLEAMGIGRTRSTVKQDRKRRRVHRESS